MYRILVVEDTCGNQTEHSPHFWTMCKHYLFNFLKPNMKINKCNLNHIMSFLCPEPVPSDLTKSEKQSALITYNIPASPLWLHCWFLNMASKFRPQILGTSYSLHLEHSSFQTSALLPPSLLPSNICYSHPTENSTLIPHSAFLHSITLCNVLNIFIYCLSHSKHRSFTEIWAVLFSNTFPVPTTMPGT